MDVLSEIYSRLKGIEAALSEPFENIDYLGHKTKYYPSEAQELFQEYNAQILKLKKEFPDQFHSLKEKETLNRPIGNDWVHFTEFNSMKMDLKRIFEVLNTFELPKKNDSNKFSSQKLDNLFKRFHKVAQTLEKRYDGRSPIIIEDEYDVQDLLEALLKIEFNDVRREDYLPSNSGSNSRIDFILKNEKIGIEVKMTSQKLRDKKLGEELLIDIGRYKGHQDCKTLFIFVYDKSNFIRNKHGMIKDIENNSTEEFSIRVYIKPDN
jgi:REase_DpnII-MboI